jgi:ABC-2 type transport system permease protein
MSIGCAVRDSATMLRRNLRHAQRYPGMTIGVISMPIIMLLLFAYVFGGAMSAGLAAANTGVAYIDYIVPGIVLMTIGSGTMPTAVGVCSDMTEGIVARFRTMAISRASVLTGHVVGSVIQTMASVALVLVVALLMGFRPAADLVGWIGAAAIIVALTFALTWLAVALGLVSKNPEGASNIVMPLTFFLPFLSSAFVPLAALPDGVRWFAANQPFTIAIETLRGLLMGTPVGANWLIAVAWCAAIALGGYLWAKKLFNRDPSR